MAEAHGGFGDSLRFYRVQATLTQQELADKAGLSVRSIRDLEKGEVTRPHSSSVERLAGALQLSGVHLHRFRAMATSPGGADHRAWLGVLGPLELRRGRSAIEIGAPRQRTLLALLALNAGRVVPTHDIAQVVWGDEPPATTTNLIHVYVSRLRRLLSGTRRTVEQGHRRVEVLRIERSNGGYRLTATAEDLDLLDFDRLVLAARTSRAECGSMTEAMELLAAALQCWRGPVLGRSDPRLLHLPAAVAVSNRRVEAALAFAELASMTGHHERVVELLRPVVVDEPLHEGLHARLMLSLAACGQLTGALAAFEAIRGRLSGELGIDPGEELSSAHVRILRHVHPVSAGEFEEQQSVDVVERHVAAQHSAPARPAQLPPDVSSFTGRGEQLRRLDALLRPRPDRQTGPRAVVISAIAGPAGVGKTALAVHWAHRARQDFPDGQLYVNLRGYSAAVPMDPAEALARFLRAMGVPPEQVPPGHDEAADLYRSLTADRRLLVVLDNAADAAQVRPLLPGGPQCAVVVTSRDRLTGLAARDGAHRIPLDVLTPAEAVALLARGIGDARVDLEPEATQQLARTCGYLPLALRIVAAHLVDRSHTRIADYLEELTSGDLLAALEIDGDQDAAPRATFEISYRRLPMTSQRVFRLLALSPGPDASLGAVAAMADTTGEAVRPELSRLVTAHLVTEHDRGRYSLHDLLRRYAAERGQADDDDQSRGAARRRLDEFYLSHIDAAASVLYPLRIRLPAPAGAVPGAPPFSFGGHDDALRWLEQERANLVAAVIDAAGRGALSEACRLADGLRGYFNLSGHAVDWETVARAGLTAATVSDDTRAQAAAHLNLADLYDGHDRQRSLDHRQRALVLAQKAGWTEAEPGILANIGYLLQLEGRFTEALNHFERSVQLRRDLGLPYADAGTNNVAAVLTFLGHLGRAYTLYQHTLTAARRQKNATSEALILGNLGELLRLLGRPSDALQCLSEAITLHRAVGDRPAEAESLCALAFLKADTGQISEALRLAVTAREIAQTVGSRVMEAEIRVALGTIHLLGGAHTEALHQHREALRIARDNSDVRVQARALAAIANVLHYTHRLDPARHHARRAQALAHSYGLQVIEGQALALLAALDMADNKFSSALATAQQSLVINRGTGHRLGQAHALYLLAAAHSRSGSPDTAAKCRRQADRLCITLEHTCAAACPRADHQPTATNPSP